MMKSIVTLLLLVSTVGCSTISHCERDAVPKQLGFVTSRGAFAKARTFEIPESGLTVGEFVELVQRVPKSTQTLTEQSSFQPTVRETVAKYTKALQPGQSVSESDLKSYRDEALRSLKSLDSTSRSNLFATSGVSSFEEYLEKLKTLVGEDKDAARQRLEAIPVGDTNSLAPAVTQPDTMALVTIQRRSGRRIIMPIQLVESWHAGDFLLADGDIVEINPKQAYVAFNREVDLSKVKSVLVSDFTNQSIALETFPSDNLANIQESIRDDLQGHQYSNIVVAHVTTSAGSVEEYLMPLLTSSVFQDSKSIYEDLLRDFKAVDGDHYHFSAIELTPLHLSSRAKLREMQRDALLEKRRDEDCNTRNSLVGFGEKRQNTSISNSFRKGQQRIGDSLNATWQSIPKLDLSAINPLAR